MALLPLRHFLRFCSRVALKHTSRREFSQLVADHIFSNKYRDMAFAIVDAEGQTDHIRRDRRAPRPGFDRWRLRPAF